MGDGQRLPRAGQGDTGGRPPTAAGTDVYSPSRIFSRFDVWQFRQGRDQTSRLDRGRELSRSGVTRSPPLGLAACLHPLLGLLGEHRFGFTPIALSEARHDFASGPRGKLGCNCVSAFAARGRHRAVAGASSRPVASRRSTRLRQRRVPISWAVATKKRCLSRRVRRPVFDVCDGDWRGVFCRCLRR